MTRQLLSLAAIFAMGAAITAEACSGCGCAAKKAKAKPAAATCPSSGCSKSAPKAACPASACTKPAAKAGCPAGACTKPAAKACPAGCTKPCCADKHSAEDHEYKVVDTAGLKKLLASKKKVTVVDARSGKWDDGRRIGKARQLAVNSSEAEIAKALPNKNATIVAYCTNTKCPASAKLAHKLVDLGYKNVVKYPEGVDGWQEAGNAITQVN